MAASVPARREAIPQTLDLEDRDIFVSLSDLPGNPLGGWIGYVNRDAPWYLIGQIESVIPWLRPMYHIRDCNGEQFLLAFHLSRGSQAEKAAYDLKPGMTICFEQPFWHGFSDGQEGLRIEDDDFKSVKYLPCTLPQLHQVNDELKSSKQECTKCNKDNATSRCSKCKAHYCNRDRYKECATNHWPIHKQTCKLRQYLRSLNDEYRKHVVLKNEVD